jgi:CTP:molybdopterin cytidylyltransferase MocA
MGASLRAGLADVEASAADAALVHLVDLPDVSADVARRVLGSATEISSALARAAYSGVAGHPVLIGRSHWAGVLAEATGDAGARGYLRTHPAVLVECGDLATGRDVDVPDSDSAPTRDQPHTQ